MLACAHTERIRSRSSHIFFLRASGKRPALVFKLHGAVPLPLLAVFAHPTANAQEPPRAYVRHIGWRLVVRLLAATLCLLLHKVCLDACGENVIKLRRTSVVSEIQNVPVVGVV